MKSYPLIIETAQVNKSIAVASTAFLEIAEDFNVRKGLEVTTLDNNIVVSASEDDISETTLFELCSTLLENIGFDKSNLLIEKSNSQKGDVVFKISYIESAEDEDDEESEDYDFDLEEEDEGEEDEDIDSEEEGEEVTEDEQSEGDTPVHIPGDPDSDKAADKLEKENKEKKDPYGASLSVLKTGESSKLVNKLYAMSCGPKDVSRYPAFWAEMDALCSKYRKKSGFVPEDEREEEVEGEEEVASMTVTEIAAIFEEMETAKKKAKFKKGRGGILSAFMSAISGEEGKKLEKVWDAGEVKRFKALLVKAAGKAAQKLKDTHPKAKDED